MAREIIIEYVKENNCITTKIATEILKLKSKSWVREVLKKMVDEEILISEGANRNRQYKLNNKQNKF